MISYIFAAISTLLILGVDQYTKYYVASNFAIGEQRSFIGGFIDLTYIRNTGGAWGMLAGNMIVLLCVTAVVMAICIVIMIKFGSKNKLLLWAMALVISGGIGNLIDRVMRGSVVDFLHFEFFPTFPVFNVADCAIVVGAGLLILYFILDTIKDAKRKNHSLTGNNSDEQN